MKKNFMDEDKVSEFELRKFFLEYYRKTREIVKIHPEYKLGQNNYHLLSQDAKDASRLFNFMNKVYGLISDLEKTHTFIKRFPLKDYYQSNDIDQLDFIKYHFEVFIHKVHTLLEVKKLWVNDFYGIGLKEEDCNWNNLKSYDKIKKSPTSIIIKNYFKSFKHIIKYRHLNTHRAYFQDAKNDELKTDLMIYTQFKKYGLEVGEDFRRSMPEFIVDYRIKKYRSEKIEYINNGIEIAKTYSEQFITIIQTEFFADKMKK
ncbi:Cthe_2314 family HEPN domain-containing protein [Psychroflexus torquis]|uniref:Cthe_2314 family HEPN domain-containing protein n=1 Tax=Psychroflexus torquis TaxID=57029 RepID=UPI0012F82C96|nr:Cthe_2314 family HEPN domain-containing protein [Psychroflexus torquis]